MWLRQLCAGHPHKTTGRRSCGPLRQRPGLIRSSTRPQTISPRAQLLLRWKTAAFLFQEIMPVNVRLLSDTHSSPELHRYVLAGVAPAPTAHLFPACLGMEMKAQRCPTGGLIPSPLLLRKGARRSRVTVGVCTPCSIIMASNFVSVSHHSLL